MTDRHDVYPDTRSEPPAAPHEVIATVVSAFTLSGDSTFRGEDEAAAVIRSLDRCGFEIVRKADAKPQKAAPEQD